MHQTNLVCMASLWIILIVLIQRTICSIQFMKCRENKYFRDVNILNDSLSDSYERNHIHCAATCGKIGNCLSYMFNKVTKRCKVFSDDFVHPTVGVSELGWKYYYAIKDCKMTEDLCPISNGYYFNTSICFCYKFYSININYEKAVETCAADGAALARITRYVRQSQAEIILGASSNTIMWIQGTRENGSDVWIFDDGTRLSFFLWNVEGGQPQLRDNGEDYLTVKKNQKYKWHDVYKSESHSLLCEFTG